MHQSVVRPSRRTARAQQDQRVDQRQVPRVKGGDAFWRPNPILQRRQRPHGIKRVLEEGPEPSGKEHHFGHDEQDKAIAQADANHWRVIAGLALMHHFGPPREHGVKHASKADQPDIRRRAVHPKHRPEQHDKGAERAEERPDRRRKNMIIVVLGVGHGRVPSVSYR